MPTKPLEAILYRELSVVQAKEVTAVASPLLQELVNYATNVLVRCATSTSGQENEDLAVLALYRHIVEMTDGVEVLVVQSCAVPAIPLVRSSFEALLSMEYILENDKEYVRRSFAWLAGYVHKRLDFYESLVPSTAKGAAFAQALRNDKTIQNVTLPPASEVQKAIDNLKRLLSRPQFQEIEAEYSRHRKRPNWYSLFGGPNDLRDLTQHLKRDAQYDFLYRLWSTTSHAHDFSPFIARSPQGESGIRGLRDPSQLKDVTSFTASFILNATRIILKKFRPEEDISKWYESEVRSRFLQIVKRSG